MKDEAGLAPAIATYKIKWWTPRGFAFLIIRSLFRYFVTGREVIGAGDNATFRHAATVDYRGGPVEKLTRARWQRLARRWIGLVVPLMLGSASTVSTVARVAFCVYVSAGLVAGSVYVVNTGGTWFAMRDLRRAYVYPAAAVLARVTGVKISKREALNMISIPEGFEDGVIDTPVRVYLPEIALDPAAKKRIADAVGSRLGLPDSIAKWTESGVPRRFVDLMPMQLPKACTLADVMDFLAGADLEHPFVGIMTNGQPSYMDFMNDSPHTLGSAGSGAGKSTLYKLIAMQRLRRGAYAIILDFKKWSHLRWAGRLPDGRVLIEDEVEAIHNVLMRVMDELMWRKSFGLDQEDELAKLPTLDVYVEEINTLMDMLRDYWTEYTAGTKQRARTELRRVRELAKDDPEFYAAEVEEAEENLAAAMALPKNSPAIQSLRYGVNLGREFRIHFHFIGQSMSAKAAGGRDTRESFRTRMLARWDAKTWKMLADGLPFVACPSTEPGIWAHVHGGTYEIVRVPFVPDADAVEYVRAGVAPSLPMFHGDAAPTLVDASVRPAVLPLSGLVAILPAKRSGEAVTLKALRLAAGRPGFPEPVAVPEPGKAALYRPEEVEAWLRDREA